MALLKRWTMADNPNKKWKEVRGMVQKFRNSLPIVTQNIPDGRATSSRSEYLPRVFRSPAWVASDLGDFFLWISNKIFSSGFIRLRGKNYGNFFIAVQSLSKQVFVKKITSKKWTAIKPAILDMLKTPGFEETKR